MQYSYSKAINSDRLSLEIRLSAIVTALGHVDTAGNDVAVHFKASLSIDDEIILGALIQAHVPTPVEQPPVRIKVDEIPAFASKTIGTKKLYRRVRGNVYSVEAGANTLFFTNPYGHAKMIGLEVINGEAMDKASLYVLDSAAGTYSTVPNYTLNQFGFDVVIPNGFYQGKSEFDADIYIGMQFKISYTSLSAKSIGVNFILNELKDA